MLIFGEESAIFIQYPNKMIKLLAIFVIIKHFVKMII